MRWCRPGVKRKRCQNSTLGCYWWKSRDTTSVREMVHTLNERVILHSRSQSFMVYDAHTQAFHCSLAALKKLNQREREKCTTLWRRSPQNATRLAPCIGANITTTDHQRAAALHKEHAETTNYTACISQRLTPRTERLT